MIFMVNGFAIGNKTNKSNNKTQSIYEENFPIWTSIMFIFHTRADEIVDAQL